MSASLARLVATAGYVGHIPFAPGTFGSLVGLPLHFAIRGLDSAVAEALALVVLFVLGLWAADRVERDVGKDPSVVVIDEVLGMLVTLAFVPVTLTGALLAFVIFRALDVLKPFPAGRLEHLHGGPGIMLDDVVAGIYSQGLLRVAALAVPGLLR